RYVARTFIQPGQELRRLGVRLKFNPLPEVVAGKRLIVVDDSIVRGNTTRQNMQMLRDAGAAEIHLRISAPPIKHPCHYGIDMSTREEMIAHGRSVEEIAEELGVDSLHYLSLEGVYEAVGVTRDTHCDACFSGEYPLPGTEAERGAELVVLAGYMQLLSDEFLARFPDRVINVHPALLPAFPGLAAVEQAISYGVKVFGVTVHFVDGGVDSGPVILQRSVELPDA